MSAYLNQPVQINTMACSTCGTEAFAWLAETFVCPTCGDDDYVVPLFATDLERENAARRTDTGEEHITFTEGRREIGSRKRKRTESKDSDTQ
ncbi:uncharacterized protein M421DRAFT_325491 [Didymella exigua CBS 183.55]|uniref:Uncharacterized protein n=1 Tax=Didymella exigua CBS 183.55 TaxID=1150837 RepID=A0A6A5R6W5_9PLEO|nr:uncharacterized protein M421DRAFT_325491 [Didymella exigua CBS 183.55]KAF1923462.1 hypothetical protein M421DRAFT_325491 [Didymella exigua CBS 183.55]